ncbi:ATP-grasp domain-containing protein [Paraburkholderia sprentiae WSM5005]|uniref:ATP-grasp domain-containing protein n=1 Tax=Paraburkholderia sprentiae WSM5005 TaxID=754502 RepID=A0A1I9YS62_9BURK|nr:ATP-grasp domain-containing protein [Paraburkholderia sprentiae]APA89043.2 ATP-grasp domain-containing protein [Paraburkholderia sprentiae WSM5005]
MQTRSKNVIVIVDGWSSGRYLAPAFIGHGYECIHISSTEKTSRFGYKPVDYIANFHLESTAMSEILENLRGYSVKAIMPGSESGVVLADLLADNFAVPRNDARTTQARRNKFHMIAALKKAGVSSMRQFASRSLRELLAWYGESKLDTVILKPTMGAKSDGVALCSNAKDIEAAFVATHGKPNVTGVINTEFVIQERLQGQELMVNSVSCEGHHFVTDMWIGVGGLVDTISTDEYAQLVMRRTEIFERVEKYVLETLDALGICNGAAHSEVMLTVNGPRLIECGARLTGAQLFAAVEEAQGYSQLSVMVETVLNSGQFQRRVNALRGSRQKGLRFVYMCSNREGYVVNNPDLSRFGELATLDRMIVFPKIGDYLTKTNGSLGRPGYAFLLSSDNQTLDMDYVRFRELEAKMFQHVLEA